MNPSTNIFPKLEAKAAGLEKVKLKLDQVYRQDGQFKHDGQKSGVRKPQTRSERVLAFWRNVIRGNKKDCWTWTGSMNNKGYGRFWWGGKLVQAHRLAYYLVTGIDPFPMLLLHSCDNPACVNPHHQFTGTDKTNAEDADSKGRRIYHNGEKCGAAKLTADQVAQIKSDYKPYVCTAPMLAKRFGVSRGCIAKIVFGESWKN